MRRYANKYTALVVSKPPMAIPSATLSQLTRKMLMIIHAQKKKAERCNRARENTERMN